VNLPPSKGTNRQRGKGSEKHEVYDPVREVRRLSRPPPPACRVDRLQNRGEGMPTRFMFTSIRARTAAGVKQVACRGARQNAPPGRCGMVPLARPRREISQVLGRIQRSPHLLACARDGNPAHACHAQVV